MWLWSQTTSARIQAILLYCVFAVQSSMCCLNSLNSALIRESNGSSRTGLLREELRWPYGLWHTLRTMSDKGWPFAMKGGLLWINFSGQEKSCQLVTWRNVTEPNWNFFHIKIYSFFFSDKTFSLVCFALLSSVDKTFEWYWGISLEVTQLWSQLFGPSLTHRKTISKTVS